MCPSSAHPPNFGSRLRAAREQKGLSQSELAEKAGLQPSAVSHFETGRRAPSFDNLRALADALSVTIDYLSGRQDAAAMAGPAAERLFRHYSKLSDAEQQTVEDFAKMLANKKKDKP
jgi:transcriptional regulator with XRE-family HTH domain